MSEALWPPLIALLWPPSWAFIAMAIWRRWHPVRDVRRVGLHWLTAGAVIMVVDFAAQEWLPGTLAAGNVLIGAWIWWHNRRRRDRAPRMYGAKSRALVAALVRKARQAAKPGRVLRPVPGGAQ